MSFFLLTVLEQAAHSLLAVDEQAWVSYLPAYDETFNDE